MRIPDLAGELRDRVGAEEEAVGIDIRRLGVPFLPFRRGGIEDCPDRAAAVELGRVAMPGHAGGKEVVGAVDLVPEALAALVHEDDVLPILHRETGGAREVKHRCAWLIDERAVTPAASDVAGL